MRKLPNIIFLLLLSFFVNKQTNSVESDQDKAIRAVNEGEILPLNQILDNVQEEFSGRVLSINLLDNEKGLFGWVYDIMIIDNKNNVKLNHILSHRILDFWNNRLGGPSCYYDNSFEIPFNLEEAVNVLKFNKKHFLTFLM